MHKIIPASILLIIMICIPYKLKAQEMNTEPEARLLLDAKAVLGEGAIWNHKEQVFWWVDIEKGQLNIYDPRTGKNKSYEMGQRIGTVVPATDGTAVVALEDGIYTYDFGSGELVFRSRPGNHAGSIRFNDGKCDPAGRLWAGTMGMGGNIRYKAYLYRFDHDFTAHTMLDSITISNGICWSADKKKMYYIDTPTMKIKEYDYDDVTGAILFSRVAVEIPQGTGGPDGMCIDAGGRLWVALYGGSAVCCFDPATGALLQKVKVPAPNVTSCAFTGKGLNTLYITTASQGMDQAARERYPHAGGLFYIELEVKGVETSFFKTE
jgi:sugar lactone lactonase YvrE